MITIEYRH